MNQNKNTQLIPEKTLVAVMKRLRVQIPALPGYHCRALNPTAQEKEVIIFARTLDRWKKKKMGQKDGELSVRKERLQSTCQVEMVQQKIGSLVFIEDDILMTKVSGLIKQHLLLNI